MPLHFFHCTDGVDLIVDRVGRETPGGGQVRRQARAVARRVMKAVPTFGDWRDWAVHVYDARGTVAIIPFEDEEASPRMVARSTPRQKTLYEKTGSTEPCQSLA